MPKELNVLSLNAFIGSLKTHEIELNEAPEKSNRKGKFIVLKNIQKKSSSSKAMKIVEDSYEDEDESSDDNDEKDEIAHFVKKISKAWIKKKKKSFVPKKDKKGKAKQDEVICFKCKEPGHVRSECPRLKKKLLRRRLQRRRL